MVVCVRVCVCVRCVRERAGSNRVSIRFPSTIGASSATQDDEYCNIVDGSNSVPGDAYQESPAVLSEDYGLERDGASSGKVAGHPGAKTSTSSVASSDAHQNTAEDANVVSDGASKEKAGRLTTILDSVVLNWGSEDPGVGNESTTDGAPSTDDHGDATAIVARPLRTISLQSGTGPSESNVDDDVNDETPSIVERGFYRGQSLCGRVHPLPLPLPPARVAGACVCLLCLYGVLLAALLVSARGNEAQGCHGECFLPLVCVFLR